MHFAPIFFLSFSQARLLFAGGPGAHPPEYPSGPLDFARPFH